jgi:uncharacterized damage-inducible protein DinB
METRTHTPLPTFISAADMLAHWQGHRQLTRRVIEAFPEDKLFTYSIGKMRPFGEMIGELLGITLPGIKGIVTDNWTPLNEHVDASVTKGQILQEWDRVTQELNHWWKQIPEERFQQTVLCFGQYEGTVWSSILYFIDNEIHHRAQAYVYLRSLGITPPNFWER